MKQIFIGILGAGNVGSGLIELIERDGAAIASRTGIEFKIKSVFDRSYAKKKFPSGVKVSDDPQIVLGDPDVQIVVELIGGINPARELITKAIESGKSVVTANKALLAETGSELFKLAEKKEKSIGFEAAVAGAIPVIRTLRSNLVSGQVRSIHGILNGTCNFIITRMEQDGLDYSDALKLAQEKGFAEANPAFDVSGQDAAQKLSIIAGIAFGQSISLAEVKCEGIEAIRPLDIKIAERMGWVIRLLAVAKKLDKEILLRVHPAMIAREHLLASVREERNAVFVDSNSAGPMLLVGQGAGSHPTATAVLSDLIDVARDARPLPNPFPAGDIGVCQDYSYRFYLRVQTQDRPGVLADIARVLSDEGISIASFHQEEGPEPVQLVIITHAAPEQAMGKAIKKLDALGAVMRPSVMIRIEDL